jgi:hypothetical protein
MGGVVKMRSGISMIKTTLCDSDIRAAVKQRLAEAHGGDPNTAVIDELSLCQGNARVDIAVVNGLLAGYEIKSDRDTLSRLPRQQSVYELCFEQMTIVVGSRHLKECRVAVPKWWGIWEAKPNQTGVELKELRRNKSNRKVEIESVVKLLWREEIIEALSQLGIEHGGRSTRRELWNLLCSSAPADDVLRIIRERIRARGDWRSVPTPFRDGGSSRSSATSQRSQANRRWLLSHGSQNLQN